MEIYLPTWVLKFLPNWIIICQDCLRDCQTLGAMAKCLINISWMKNAIIILLKRKWTLHWMQHRLPYQYSQINSFWGLRSIQCWNQCLKYYSSSTIKWRQNQMTYTFFLDFFPHKRYGVSDVASLLLFMVWLEKLYSLHPLQSYITGTWLNPMMSKITENWCWCHLSLPLIKVNYNHLNLFKKVWTGSRFQKIVKNQLNMDKLCSVRLLRLIWQIPRTHHSNNNKHSISHHCVIWRFIWSHHHTQGFLWYKDGP